MSLSEVTENLPGLQVNIYCVQKSRIKILRLIVSTKYFYRKLKVIILVKNRLIY